MKISKQELEILQSLPLEIKNTSGKLNGNKNIKTADEMFEERLKREMTCPYINKKIVIKTIIQRDEDFNEIGSVQEQVQVMEKCKKENCAVWYNEKCNFAE